MGNFEMPTSEIKAFLLLQRLETYMPLKPVQRANLILALVLLLTNLKQIHKLHMIPHIVDLMKKTDISKHQKIVNIKDSTLKQS